MTQMAQIRAEAGEIACKHLEKLARPSFRPLPFICDICVICGSLCFLL
jgi:hypothetical protein